MYQLLLSIDLSECVDLTPEQWANDPTCMGFSETPMSQQDICSTVIPALMPDYINMIFSVQVVNKDVVDDIHTLTYDIHQAFANSLSGIDWLSQNQSNIAAVQFKLQNILQNIGHSSVMNKYAGVRTSPTAFYASIFSVYIESYNFLLSQWDAPYNRSDETFDARWVNAFYDPTRNTINFPAAILESPMFSSSWPALWQYARIGYVVGHESIHGFDNQGSHYDAYGNHNDIFDQNTRALYDQKSQCIVDYYNKFVVYDNVTLNGQQTLPENIADIGGVKNSFRGYKLWVLRNGPEFDDGELVTGMTTDQIFFTIMGQTWCAVSNTAYLKQQVRNDVHSPARFRVLGSLSQYDQFANAFHCPTNSAMNPADRCDLW
jgi:predicted metalloendopeptidase